MRQIGKILVLTFILSAAFSRSQTVTSICSGPDSLVKKYRKTADKLSIANCVKISDTYKDSITINPLIRSNYLKALLAVYNATALPARDTIVFFNVTLDYKFWPYAALNTILIDADSTKAWVANLRQNIVPCGYAAIDNLFTRYYLKVTGSSIIFPPQGWNPFNCRINIKTDTNCFTNRLCDKFNAMYVQGGGVGNASPQSTFSDSYNITDSVNVNFTELTYSIGWGDCMAGCIYRRYWKFRVYNGCSVEYMGSSGAAIPPEFFTGLQTQALQQNDLKIYPNPANGVLYIRSALATTFKIKLVSLDGRDLLIKESFDSQHDVIDVSHFSKGIYILTISNNDGAVTRKVVIE